MDGPPMSYADWKRCIEVDCSIPLTVAFCEKRIKALNNPRDTHTAAFRKQWGDDHLARVVGWFEQALETDARAD